jgi:CO dehydrogenase nickel-insertion accessory protein CooC1
MATDQKVLAGMRIGVFGKGGAGKSTLTVLLSKTLSTLGYKVCILDADSTNIGLSRALGYDQPPDPLLDFFGGMVFSGGLVTCPVDDPAPLPNAMIDIQGLPKEYYQNKEGITLLTAGKIGSHGPGAGCDGPIAKIARDLKIEDSQNNLITLIDFKAGFEDSARGALTSLDWVIVVVDPTTAAVEMALDMRNMVEQIKADVLPATSHLESEEMVILANKIFTEASIKHVFFILNKVVDPIVEEYLREELEKANIEPIGVIYQEDDISTSWLRGLPFEAVHALEETKRIIEKLERFEKEKLTA